MMEVTFCNGRSCCYDMGLKRVFYEVSITAVRLESVGRWDHAKTEKL